MPQDFLQSIFAVAHGASQLVCRWKQILVQLRANAACAELAKTTAASMAANRILFMGNSLADKFPNTMRAFRRAFSLSTNVRSWHLADISPLRLRVRGKADIAIRN
jgi:hypothetical protein